LELEGKILEILAKKIFKKGAKARGMEAQINKKHGGILWQ